MESLLSIQTIPEGYLMMTSDQVGKNFPTDGDHIMTRVEIEMRTMRTNAFHGIIVKTRPANDLLEGTTEIRIEVEKRNKKCILTMTEMQ